MTIMSERVRRADAQGLAGDAMALYRRFESNLDSAWNALLDKPAETPATTVAALWHAASGHPLSVQRACEIALPLLAESGVERLHALVAMRLQGIPLAYLTGRQQFMGIELHASAEALIPRVETELLGYAALEQLRAIIHERHSATVIDVCTGSGNLALALASHEPSARVWGADLSADAVALARRNAAQHKLSDRVTFLVGDLLAPLDVPGFHRNVDLLVCNPPYISSGKLDTLPDEIIEHEPRLAFDGGPLGIRVLQRLINEAPRFLRQGGWLAFEVGLGQGRGMRRRIEQHGSYQDVYEIAGKGGEVRALLARARMSRVSDTGHPSPGNVNDTGV